MLSRKDGDLGWFPQYFRASFKDGDRYITLKLNGHVRSVVESISFTNTAYQLEMNKDYKMCNLPQEKVGGYFWLRMSDNSCQSIQNPPVTFYPDSVLPAKVLNLPSILESKLVPVDLYRGGGEFILFDGLNDEFCNQIHDVTEETDAPGK